jgi:preprotein translocase subunit SecG
MITLARFVLGFMLAFTAIFLILLVLVQRGRGGGLAGALGGMGGQSAFGTKAGDVFTKITIGAATFWILLCILSVNVLGRQESLLSGDLGGSAPIPLESPAEGDGAATVPGETTPAEPADAAEPPADDAAPADDDAAPADDDAEPADDAAPADDAEPDDAAEPPAAEASEERSPAADGSEPASP